jgi:hypothetical protein
VNLGTRGKSPLRNATEGALLVAIVAVAIEAIHGSSDRGLIMAPLVAAVVVFVTVFTWNTFSARARQRSGS